VSLRGRESARMPKDERLWELFRQVDELFEELALIPFDPPQATSATLRQAILQRIHKLLTEVSERLA
jgi:hypothetical protein